MFDIDDLVPEDPPLSRDVTPLPTAHPEMPLVGLRVRVMDFLAATRYYHQQ